MEYTEAKVLELSRGEGDSYIMDEICSLGIFSDDQLYDINAGCLHWKVTTLSDITNGFGTCIITEALDGAPLADQFSPLKWPHQPVVKKSQQNLWKCAIKAAYLSNGSNLRTPLGAWVFDSYNDMSQLLQHLNQTSHHIYSDHISGWPPIHQTCGYFLHKAPL
jgi:hypothetical protein